MAFFNDLKKILFGAKSVTQSAADKAVDATKEASAELWDKVQDTATDLGKAAAEKAELAMDKAADLAEAAKEKVSELVNDKPKPAEPEATTADTDDVMDAIMAERGTTPASSPAAEHEDDSLELPPLQAAPNAPKLLDDGKADEPVISDSIQTTAPIVATEAKGEEGVEKAGDFASQVGGKVLDAGEKFTEKFGKTAENVGDAIFEKGGEALDKAGDFASKVGEKVMDAGEKFTEKFGETAENVGEVIFEKGGEALEKAKGLAADIGSKILEAKDELMAKAQAEAEKSGETTASLIDKAKDLNQKLEDKISGNNAKFADKPLDTGGSEFAKHGSFWEKAERFSKGDYQMKGEEDRLELKQIKFPENKAEKPENKGKKTDDLIDDATIIEE